MHNRYAAGESSASFSTALVDVVISTELVMDSRKHSGERERWIENANTYSYLHQGVPACTPARTTCAVQSASEYVRKGIVVFTNAGVTRYVEFIRE